MAYYYIECRTDFSTSLNTLITSFFTDRKFKISVEGEFFTRTEIMVWVPRGSFSPKYCAVYLPGILTHFGKVVDDISLRWYICDR
jgi:hypothetical protein